MKQAIRWKVLKTVNDPTWNGYHFSWKRIHEEAREYVVNKYTLLSGEAPIRSVSTRRFMSEDPPRKPLKLDRAPARKLTSPRDVPKQPTPTAPETKKSSSTTPIEGEQLVATLTHDHEQSLLNKETPAFVPKPKPKPTKALTKPEPDKEDRISSEKPVKLTPAYTALFDELTELDELFPAHVFICDTFRRFPIPDRHNDKHQMSMLIQKREHVYNNLTMENWERKGKLAHYFWQLSEHVQLMQ